jgi:hypothetical protein
MQKFYKKKHILTSVFVIFLLFGISVLVYAYSNGVSGCTLKSTSNGCGRSSGCHSTSSNSSVTVTLSGPDTVLAGSNNNYTFSVSTSGTFSRGGIDIAVSDGTLGIGTSTGIKMSSGEVVHSARFTSATTKTFTFTAPSTPGTITMYGTGAAGSSSPPPWNNAPNKTIVVKTISGIENNVAPVSFSLSQNYPNPFNPITKIDYSVTKSGNVKLAVYDILGNQVYTLINHKHEAGNYSVEFDGSKLSSGTYIYKIESGNFTSTKKMLMIK